MTNTPAPDERCNWTQDEDGIWWACEDNAWCFDDGQSPADHFATYCMFCGKKITQESYKEPEPDEEEAP